ncbi:MAG: hypothetical protein LBQ87_07055 [Candidatus Fibromonas sp.]|jgi:hypothetical protein|nr:hypothetical protein [Candidatus Fibromonas sp.]
MFYYAKEPLVKAYITALIFGFAFNQSVAADVCDFEYSGDYYANKSI